MKAAGLASDPRLSALLASLYGGLDAERPWEEFLAALGQWLGAPFATMIISAPGRAQPGTFVTPGADAGLIHAYIERFFAADPFSGLPEGRVTSFAEFLAGQDAARFAAYRDYLRQVGGEQVLAVDLRFEGQYEARFRVTRTEAEAPFSPDDKARLQALVPHLRAAVALFEKLQFGNAQHALLRSATEGLGLALLVIDRQHRVISANALANRILAEGEGVRLAGGALRLDSAPLRARLEGLLQSGTAAGAVARFRIPRADHGDLVATARGIELPAIHAGTGALALFLARPGEALAPDPASIADLLGVTVAEARLCAMLARGHSLVGAARALGVAHNTAKAQLRSVFAKTGVHRQAQLVSLLGTLNG